jgi:hypothetical protein
MKILPEHIKALRAFGYTESEARFLYIVATHSGYFTQRHFCQFSGTKTGGVPTGFSAKLIARKHASQRNYQNNAHVFHLTHKPIYRAIGRENIRNRRSHSLEYVKIRLAILDFILAHPDHHYFEGESDKVQYFQERLQVRPQEMPSRTYAGSNHVPDTIRYFVDKLPLFLDSTAVGQPLLTLSYIDPGFGSLSGFKTHLQAYSAFLSRLPRFAFLFASPHSHLFPKAKHMFEEFVLTKPGKLSAHVARYFRLRSSWEAKRYEALSNEDLEFLNHAKQCFAGEPFDSAYAKWQAGTLWERGFTDELERGARRSQEIHFRTFILPRDYSLFGQNSQFVREPC